MCHRRENLASVALPTFERSKNRDNPLYHTEPPHSAATSSCHRHLWTQRYHFGQHSRPWSTPRFNFIDDRTRKPYLPDCLRPTVHALVTSRLDLGNAALYGITGTLLYILEMVQRSAARVILRLYRRDQHSMTEALRELHWLPVTQHIDFKLLTFMHSAVHANSPRYLADRITPYVPHRSLRSADQALVCVPRVNLKRFGRRAFSCAGPAL